MSHEAMMWNNIIEIRKIGLCSLFIGSSEKRILKTPMQNEMHLSLTFPSFHVMKSYANSSHETRLSSLNETATKCRYNGQLTYFSINSNDKRYLEVAIE